MPINDNLEAMAKQLYDYWFVQFDFPNEEGKPYKSSGSAMVWNEKLKRDIPQGWSDCILGDICDMYQPKTLGLNDLSEDSEYKVYGANGIIGHYSSYNHENSEIAMACRGNSCGTINRTSPKSWITGNAMVIKFRNKEINNEYIKQALKYANVKGAISGSGQPQLTRENLSLLKMTQPNYAILEAFSKKVAAIVAMELEIEEQNDNLTKQRDELLPLLMNGQASVNYHLSVLFLSSLILYRDQYKLYDMKKTIIRAVLDGMRAVLTENQLELLTDVTQKALSECEITPKATEEEQRNKENAELLGTFISSKKVEGCSDKTIHYYKSSIEKLIATVKKNVCDIATNDIRCYLAEQQEQRGLSKVTIDNLRRIYSSFFSWLEDEDYITKSPVRRIHKVRTDALVKEVLTDENIEVLRDSCQELRDIAMIDLLLSTGMRVGELVKINREDIDFQERQCVVFGKGNKEREVYFNARTKIHLKKYLEQRTDTNPALFVSLHEPHTRLTISGVEVRLRQLGKKVNLNKVHPHKFRRTLATMAIDKGMPIEQVQKMLGHVKIDTTLHYAMVNQTNVKIAHRKFLN